MAKYKRIVTTEAGLQLLAAAVAGGMVTFTAVKTGSGIYTGTEELSGATSGKLLHTGISAPVVVSVNEPADTAALWVDTSVMALKIYKNGSWTVIR